MNTWIDARAVIGQDTVIEPFTYLHGQITVGNDCRIGAGCVTTDLAGDGSAAIVLGQGVCVGPGSVLNAPVTLGDGQTVAPGTVIGRTMEPSHKEATGA
jgi:bifunctional UDP-N-acetylglucosamine pyrophosphorylase/glucosamine-1-phosphate N-acetyltransferase